jgi:hypothetical protein
MARKRMIDPSLWSDDGFAELTPRQQVLYIGLFSTADDEGKLKGSATALALALPAAYMATPLDEIEADLEAVLERMTKIERYTVNGFVYLRFKNYQDWQKIDHPSKSKLPDPGSGSFGEHSGNDQGTLGERSKKTRPNRIEVNRTEEKLTEERGASAVAGRKPTPLTRAHRLPEDWEPNETVQRIATDHGITGAAFTAEVAAFKNHYLANGKTMVDWQRTAMNWMARAPQFNRGSPKNGHIPSRDNVMTGDGGWFDDSEDNPFAGRVIRAAAPQ